MATARLMGGVSTVALIVKNDTLGYCRMNMACSSCITRPRVNRMLQAASDPHSLLCLSWRTLFFYPATTPHPAESTRRDGHRRGNHKQQRNSFVSRCGLADCYHDRGVSTAGWSTLINKSPTRISIIGYY